MLFQQFDVCTKIYENLTCFEPLIAFNFDSTNLLHTNYLTKNSFNNN